MEYEPDGTPAQDWNGLAPRKKGLLLLECGFNGREAVKYTFTAWSALPKDIQTLLESIHTE